MTHEKPKLKRTVTTEAERQYARFNLLTTGQVAARLSDENITGDTVRSWIEDEENGLRAVDLRRKGAKQPYWMVEWEWVLEFLERRMRNRGAA